MLERRRFRRVVVLVSIIFILGLLAVTCYTYLVKMPDLSDHPQSTPDSDLVVEGTAKFVGGIGYGWVFEINIQNISAGRLQEERFSLIVSDKEESNFLSSHQDPQKIELGFTLMKDQPSKYTPSNGFIDQEKRSWQIKYIHDAKMDN